MPQDIPGAMGCLHKRRLGSRFPHRVWPLAALTIVLALQAGAAWALGVREFTCCVPMRDGVCLATDVYLPRIPKGAFPVLLIRTPGGNKEIGKRQARFVCHEGYALVVQDVRGCHQSTVAPLLLQSGGLGQLRDGHDTIHWITRQPWCDGNVGTWGPSIIGFAQNLTAPDAPSALRAQHVLMAFSNMYTQAAYQGGALRKELVEGWLSSRKCGPEMLAAVREHPVYDPFWAQFDPESQADRVNVPAVFWGGWYDAFLQGTIGSFVSIQHRGGPRARGNCRLILGPWSHYDLPMLADPRKTSQFPRAGDAVRFFGYWLQGQQNGVPCDAPVHYYTMGDPSDPSVPGNRWRTAADWPPPAEPTRFYFHASGRLSHLAPTGDDKRTFRYDPSNPVPTVGGQNLNIEAGPCDQRSAEDRPDVLVFTSDTLAEPLEATGQILAQLNISSDTPDTDFTVKLTDVYPDGRSLLVTDGILRARFRKSFGEQHWLEPGKVYPIMIDVGSTSIAFSRGHRIRVAISSSNSPRFEPNPNTGSAVGPPRVATNTVFLSKDHSSHLILPVPLKSSGTP